MKFRSLSGAILERARWQAASLLILGLWAGGAGCRPKEMPPEVPALLHATVESTVMPAEARREPERAEAWREVRDFYRRRGFQPVWLGPKGPLPQARELVTAIGPAGREGIDPRRYGADRLEELLDQAEKTRSLDAPETQQRLADLDLTLTYTFMTLAQHLAVGRERPSEVDVEWYREARRIDLDKLLAKMLEQPGNLDRALLGLVPSQPEYGRLRDALAQLREIARSGGWPTVPEEALHAKKGRFEPAVAAALRARLAASGDLAQSEAPLADGALAQAIAHFQSRHGLDPTGTMDAGTLEAMNVPVEGRIRQITDNMERWRWMPRDLGDRYIKVNVPDFRLEVVEGGRVVHAQRVVVGKEQSRTPSFSGRMTYLVLNPTWNIPEKIAREEVMPAVARNPDYLASKGIEVVRGWDEDAEVLDPAEISEVGVAGSDVRLRARSGEDNPLGKIKFMFPNRFDVYLHDTPADHLFAREERDFSHGCVRLEKPFELASYLLRDDSSQRPEKLQQEIATGETRSVRLPRPIPVHILYWTAWVSDDGQIQFRKDIYGHDETLDEALRAEPPIALDLAAVRGQLRAAR